MITAPIRNVVTNRTGGVGSLVLIAGHSDWNRFSHLRGIEEVYFTDLMPCEIDAYFSIGASRHWRFPLRRYRSGRHIFLHLGNSSELAGLPGPKDGGHRI